jgi:hypothetical protein
MILVLLGIPFALRTSSSLLSHLLISPDERTALTTECLQAIAEAAAGDVVLLADLLQLLVGQDGLYREVSGDAIEPGLRGRVSRCDDEGIAILRLGSRGKT